MATTLYLTATTCTGTKPNTYKKMAQSCTVYAMDYDVVKTLSTSAGTGKYYRYISCSAVKGNDYPCFMGQWVSPPLASQTLTGTITITLDSVEDTAKFNQYPWMYIYVWKGDGTGIRGDILNNGTAQNADLSGTESGTSEAATAYWSATSFTDLAVSSGDVIVVEWASYGVCSETGFEQLWDYYADTGTPGNSRVAFSMNIAWFTGPQLVEGISINDRNENPTANVQRLKKRFVMRFSSSNSGRPQQGITVGDGNSGAVARLKKKFVMTFKNATAGASRGRESITVTAPVSGWPKLIKRVVKTLSEGILISELNVGAVARLRKRFTKKIVELTPVRDKNLSWKQKLVRKLRIWLNFTVPDVERESFETYSLGETSISGWTTTSLNYTVSDTFTPPDGVQYLNLLPTLTGRFSGHLYHPVATTVDSSHPSRFKFWIRASTLPSSSCIFYLENSGSSNKPIAISFSSSSISIEDGDLGTAQYLTGAVADDTWYGILVDCNRSTNTWGAAAGQEAMPDSPTHWGGYWVDDDINRLHINPEYRYNFQLDCFEQLDLSNFAGPKVFKRFTMTFKNATSGASRGRESITVTAPPSGWPKFVGKWKRSLTQAARVVDTFLSTRGSKWKRSFTDGFTVGESNSGAVARLKKRFTMTFKNATAGASRGRESITVTAPATGWPKLIIRMVRAMTQGITVSELNYPTPSVVRLKKRIVMTFKNTTGGASRGRESITIAAPASGWPKFVGRFVRKFTEGMTIGHLNVPPLFRLKFKLWKRLSQGARVVDNYLSTRGSKWKRSFTENWRITDNLKKRFTKKIIHAAKVVDSALTVTKISGITAKVVTEVLRVADNLRKKFAKRMTKEGLTVTDVIGRRKFWKRLSQSARVVDTYLSTRGSKWKRSFSQGISVTANFARTKFWMRLTHGIRITDNIGRRKFWKRLNQGARVIDTYLSTRGSRWKRSFTENWRATDNLKKRFIKKVYDQPRVVDTYLSTRGSKWKRSFSQGLTVTDRLYKRFTKKVIHGLTTTANLSSRAKFVSRLTQGLTVTDRVFKRFKRRLYESARVVDTYLSTRGSRWVRKLVQDIRITDYIKSFEKNAIFVIQALAVGFTFSTQRSKWVRKFTESLTVTDRLFKTFRRKLSDAFTVGHLNVPPIFRLRFKFWKRLDQGARVVDTFASTRGSKWVRKFAQGLTVTDTLFKRFKKKLSESSRVMDNYLSTRGSKWVRKFTQDLRVTDNLRRGFWRRLSQAARVVDNLSLRGKWIRKFQQGVTVADNVRKRFFKVIAQSLTVKDTLTLFGRLIQLCTAALRVTDNLRKKFTKRLRDAPGVVDIFASTRGSKWRRSFIQGVTVTDRLFKRFTRRLSEAPRVVDSFLSTRGSKWYRKFTQGIYVTDNLRKRFVKWLRDYFSVTDRLSSRSRFIRQLSQALRVTDVLVTRARFVKKFQQGLTISATYATRFRKWLSHSLRVTDNLTKLNFWKRIRESTLFGTVITPTVGGYYIKKLIEGWYIAAQLSFRGSKYIRKFIQGLTVTPTEFTRFRKWVRDVLTVVDTSLRKRFGKRIREPLPVTDTLIKRIKMPLRETLRFADSLFKRFKKALAQDIRTTDALARKAYFRRALQQGMTIADRLLRRFTRRLSQGVTITDWLSRIKFWKRISEAIRVTDQLSTKARIRKAIAQGFTIVVNLTKKGVWKRIAQDLNVTANYRAFFKRIFSEGIRVSASMFKRFFKGISETLRTAASLKSRFSKVLSQGLRISTALSLAGLFAKKIAQALNLVDNLSKSLWKRITQSLLVTDTLSFIKGQILRLVQALTITDSLSKLIYLYRKLIESIRFEDFQITDVAFEILSVTPLAGTFPRPARVATLSLKVTRKGTGTPISGATVNVVMLRPDGTTYKTLHLVESTHTPGLYSQSFKVIGSDELGSYPFTATATYGVSSGTYSGFITIFQGPLAGIHFR